MLFGTEDFELDWQGEGGEQVRLRFLGEVRRLRIEVLDGSSVVILKDFRTGDAFLMIAEGTRGLHGAVLPPLGAFRGRATGETRKIADETCAEFDVDGQTMCITHDGIPLTATENGVRMTATRLLRQKQNAALFAPPKGMPLKPMPGATGGALPKLPQ